MNEPETIWGLPVMVVESMPAGKIILIANGGSVLVGVETYVNLRVYPPNGREIPTCIVPELPTHDPD